MKTMLRTIKKSLFPFFIFCSFATCIGCKSVASSKKSASLTYKDTVFTSNFYRTSGWISGDIALSIPLNNDKSLWVFGDSHIDHFDSETKTVPCLFQARNAALEMGITNPKDQKTHIGKESYSLFKHTKDDDYWFWPGPGLVNKDTVYVFQAMLHNTGAGGMWGFEAIDSLYVAKMHIPTMEITDYAYLGSRDNISFNNSIIDDGGGYHLVYGIRDNGFGNDLLVARFSGNDPQTKWEYFDGSGWSGNVTNAKKVFAEFTASFYVFKWKNKYVLITTEFSVDCNQGKEIYTYTSDTPYGPFENKKTVWTVDDTVNGHYPFFYMAMAHPEYDNGKNELLITYSINGYGECFDMCIDGRMDPNHYRPKAIRVPYKLIDESL